MICLSHSIRKNTACGFGCGGVFPFSELICLLHTGGIAFTPCAPAFCACGNALRYIKHALLGLQGQKDRPALLPGGVRLSKKPVGPRVEKN